MHEDASRMHHTCNSISFKCQQCQKATESAISPGWQFNWFFDRLNHGLNNLGAYLGAYLGAFPV